MGLVLQKQHLALLVDLVEADGLDVDELLHVGHVVLRAGKAGDAGAGLGDLGGGEELKDHVGISVLSAQGQHVGEGDKVTLELMDAVGVVPHDQEVGSGGLQGGHAADDPVREDDALGVGELGHAPDALHGGVLDRLLHGVHIGAFIGHGDGDQLKAEGLGDLEMAVIAGDGAQPLDSLLLAPGAGAAQQAVGIGLTNGVVHQLQAGISAHKHLLRTAAQDLRKKTAGSGDTGQFAIGPHIDAVSDVIGRVPHQVEEAVCLVDLLLAGLAAGHVQIQALRLQVVEFLLQAGVFRLALFRAHLGVCHGGSSFPMWY